MSCVGIECSDSVFWLEFGSVHGKGSDHYNIAKYTAGPYETIIWKYKYEGELQGNLLKWMTNCSENKIRHQIGMI